MIAADVRVVFDLDEGAYHEVDAFSSSGIGALRRSPAHYLARKKASNEPSDAMLTGSVTHLMTMQPELVDKKVRVLKPYGRGKSDLADKERDLAQWKSEGASFIVTPAQWDAACNMAKSVRAHPAARLLLSDCSHEVSIFWKDTEFDIDCKARIDAWRRPNAAVVDLKTTRDASPEAFGRSAWNYGYVSQAAHYWDAVRFAQDGQEPPFYAWVAVENEEPYSCAVYSLTASQLEAGRAIAREARSIYANALHNNDWHAYSQLINPLSLPAWATRSYE